MQKTLIHCEEISGWRGSNWLFNNINLTVASGEIVMLIGNNGVGKTTLLEIIAGARPLQGGQLHNFCQPSHWLGYLPTQAPLYPQLTVRRYLETCALLRQRSVADVARVINLCGLESVLTKRCGQLSHGFGQRTALAQALLHRPQLLLLDELSNGLDYGQKQEFMALLRRIKGECGILMISHDWQEVGQLADRLYLLQEGGNLREISLPIRTERQRWLQTRDPATAARLAADFPGAYLENSFLAVNDEAATAAALAKHVAAIVALYPHYPAAALAEKLHAP